MATMAEMLVAGAQKSISEAPEGIAQGVQLAQRVQAIQQNRQQLEQQKEQIMAQKIDKFTTAIETGTKIKETGARNAFFKSYIPSMRKALGLQDVFPEDTMQLVQADPEFAKRISYLRDQVRQGNMDFSEALGNLSPEALAQIDIESFEEASKFAATEGGKFSRAAAIQKSQQGRFDVNQMQKVKDDFDTATKTFKEAYTAGDSALALLDTKGPIAAEAVKTQLARLAGEKGPLTDQDVARFGGSRDLLSRADTLLTKLTTGDITPETRKEYKKIIGEMQQVVRAKIVSEEERQVGSAEALGLNPNQVRKVLGAGRAVPAGKPVAPEGETIQVGGKNIALSSIREAFQKAKDQGKFIEEFAAEIGKSIDEVRKLLGE